jgi:hypothetical protein
VPLDLDGAARDVARVPEPGRVARTTTMLPADRARSLMSGLNGSGMATPSTLNE